MRRLSIEQIRLALAKEGYGVLSEYNGAHYKLKLCCPNGHIWYDSWKHWKEGRRCPYCRKSKVYFKDIVLAFEKEGYKVLTKSNEYINTKQKLLYICPNGHNGSISWNHWKSGIRCKQCFINKMKKNFEDIKKSVQKENFVLLSSKEDYKNERSKLLFKCPRGHEFIISYSSWRSGSRCPICAIERKRKKLALDYNYIKNNIEEEQYKLISTNYINAFEKIEVKCPNGHVYKVRWNDWQQGYRCPHCNVIVSKGETEIYEFLLKLDPNVTILRNDRTLIKPKEIDLLLPEKKLAIEYCGLYWHSELFKESNYHLNKLNLIRKKGYRAIFIFSDEWEFKKDIVKMKLKHILNKNDAQKIYARNCEIKEISTNLKNDFLQKFHLQGRDISTISLGAFYGNELVAVMTFSKGSISKGHRFKDGVWELNRFAINFNYRVIGIASRLLEYFKRNYEWYDIFSYADRRWSIGTLYDKLNFVLVGITKPGYWYSKDGIHRIHRFNLRKTKQSDMTELELRSKEGYFRIWDCGNFKYRLVNGGNYGKEA